MKPKHIVWTLLVIGVIALNWWSITVTFNDGAGNFFARAFLVVETTAVVLIILVTLLAWFIENWNRKLF